MNKHQCCTALPNSYLVNGHLPGGSGRLGCLNCSANAHRSLQVLAAGAYCCLVRRVRHDAPRAICHAASNAHGNWCRRALLPVAGDPGGVTLAPGPAISRGGAGRVWLSAGQPSVAKTDGAASVSPSWLLPAGGTVWVHDDGIFVTGSGWLGRRWLFMSVVTPAASSVFGCQAPSGSRRA